MEEIEGFGGKTGWVWTVNCICCGYEVMKCSSEVMWTQMLWVWCAGLCCWRCHTLHHCVTESVKSPSYAVMTVVLGRNIRSWRLKMPCRDAWVLALKVKVIISAWCMGARLLPFSIYPFFLSINVFHVVLTVWHWDLCASYCIACPMWTPGLSEYACFVSWPDVIEGDWNWFYNVVFLCLS